MSNDRPSETSWSLIRRAASGDAPSRSMFGRTYLPLVRSFLAGRWRGTPLAEQIDDAVQDVFVECFRQNGSLSRADADKGDFRGFLFGVVRHVALRVEARARSGPVENTQLGSLDTADHGDRASRAFDRGWARMLMREAGDLMRERADDDGARLRVELLRLRFVGDLPINEIAARWSMDPAATHRQYSRARSEFRQCLRAVVARHAVRTEQELDDECRRLFELLAD